MGTFAQRPPSGKAQEVGDPELRFLRRQTRYKLRYPAPDGVPDVVSGDPHMMGTRRFFVRYPMGGYLARAIFVIDGRAHRKPHA